MLEWMDEDERERETITNTSQLIHSFPCFMYNPEKHHLRVMFVSQEIQEIKKPVP